MFIPCRWDEWTVDHIGGCDLHHDTETERERQERQEESGECDVGHGITSCDVLMRTCSVMLCHLPIGMWCVHAIMHMYMYECATAIQRHTHKPSSFRHRMKQHTMMRGCVHKHHMQHMHRYMHVHVSTSLLGCTNIRAHAHAHTC